MMDCQIISITIDQPWEKVYEAIWRPETFPQWASGLATAPLVKDGDRWVTAGPGGPIAIRFTPHNPYGVMDHWVEMSGNEPVYVPLRVIANGSGAEVQLTLFRQPGMSAKQFEDDASWVLQDLKRLRTLFAVSRYSL